MASDFKQDCWQVLSRTSLLHKPPWLEVYQEVIRLPNDQVVLDYYNVTMPHYTGVFAVTPDEKVLVLECYRHAVGEVTLTVPGGMLEPGEDPLIGVQRELLEETGYKATVWTSIGSFVGNATRGCGTYHFFYAQNAHLIQPPNSGDLEELNLLLWTPSQVEQSIYRGRVKSVGVLALFLWGLQWLKQIT
jgi:ADP-ribose pyrophosphatase